MMMVTAQFDECGERCDVQASLKVGRGARASSSSLSRHLPALRRYACAVSTSQESANAVVHAALSGLVEGTTTRMEAVEPRLAMFRAFHNIWSSLQRIVEPDGSSLEWAVLRLATRESFSLSETAFITGRTRADVEAILRTWIPGAVPTAASERSDGSPRAPMNGVFADTDGTFQTTA